ncbi:MAG: type IV secretion system DNA-binding domain-containing protein [Saprospiraceae bacterium]|nr:type IV secretion system DNA-binding domain-containing protein [Saprospiraceae bacterium]MCF8252446.1 type IV secretion system DNA-binding domain-containing protein [Saprospiraceae bacterium]MCF8282293.1 type IV secretion system DNA-binding domain-containing protein [Bacteroidales bacterium]MCF8314028.1 type IV secretion system DNA-binding domain-containing protein [Saprospiraceae bacterium]MCF8442776.1 type IV secretion system DNA-binding domain-containing protein [Saprospiraceae bacterium]
MQNEDITYFGRINWQRDQRLFGIKQEDRLTHTYMIGKTGTGKSTCIETMLLQDINAGRGCCLLDPHGDLVEKVEKAIPEWRKKDVVYFNIPDLNLNLRYNPFKRVTFEKRSLVASGILEVFSKLWGSAWGVKLEHILRFTILTLLDQPKATIADIPEILLNKDFRREALRYVKSESVKKFWKREFVEYNKYDLLPVLNKVGGMLVHPVIRRVLIENSEEVSLRKAIDEKKIVLVNLSKGHLGEDVTHILGALFITSIASASFSRVDTAEDDRVPFMLYIDEFHNFTTLSLVNMFSELRKFKVGMILAHQYLNQIDEDIKRAVLGNVGTVISFRVGTEDAMHMAKEMYPEFDVEDFINLPNYKIYLKLMIDGKPSRPFSAITCKSQELV